LCDAVLEELRSDLWRASPTYPTIARPPSSCAVRCWCSSAICSDQSLCPLTPCTNVGTTWTQPFVDGAPVSRYRKLPRVVSNHFEPLRRFAPRWASRLGKPSRRCCFVERVPLSEPSGQNGGLPRLSESAW